MSVTFARLYDEGSQTSTTTFAGIAPASDVLRYRVPGAKKSDALANASLAAVLGAAHPEFGALFPTGARAVQRIGAGAATDMGWIVEVEYAINRTNGSGVGPPPPDTTNLGYILDATSSRIDTITIPIIHIQRVYMPVLGALGGPSVITNGVLKRHDIKQVLPMTTYELTINRTKTSMGQAAVFQIRAQTGKVHTFGGQKWLFQGGDSRETEDGALTVVYRWLNDPGTPAIPQVTEDTLNKYRMAPARGAFQEYVIRYFTSANGPDAAIGVVDTYESVPNGHQSLPGVYF